MEDNHTLSSNELFIPLLNLKGCRGSTTSSDATPIEAKKRELSLDSGSCRNFLPFQDFASSRDPSLDRTRSSTNVYHFQLNQSNGLHSIRPMVRPPQPYLSSYVSHSGLNHTRLSSIRSRGLLPPHHFSNRLQQSHAPARERSQSNSISVESSSTVLEHMKDTNQPNAINLGQRLSQLHIPPHFFSRIALDHKRRIKKTSPFHQEMKGTGCDRQGGSFLGHRSNTPLSLYSDLGSSCSCSSLPGGNDKERFFSNGNISKHESIAEHIAGLELCMEMVQQLLYEWQKLDW